MATGWRIRTFAVLILGAFALQAASSGTQTNDSFIYSADSLHGKNGGTGWSGAWGAGNISTIATGLTPPSGTLPVAGGAIQLNLGSILATTSSTRAVATSMGTPGSTAWFSFLLKPDNTGALSYCGLNIGTNGGTQYFVGYQATNFVLNRSGGGGTSVSISFATAGFTVGQTAFIVLKVAFTVGNDSATIYINPTAGLSQPDSPPASTGTKFDLDLGTFSSIAIVGGRGLSVNNAQLDEIRVDTTYASVAPLPIQLSSFTARYLPGTQQVSLGWTTLSEINNFGVEVQRKREDESDFSTVPQSFIPGHGSTLIEHQYAFTDKIVPQGVWCYRLRQIDLDGTVNYSDALVVQVGVTNNGHTAPDGYALHQNFPNPFNPTTVISYHLPAGQAGLPVASNVRLVVYDLVGRELATLVNERKSPGSYTVTFDATNLSSGTYLVRLQAGGMVQTRRMVVLK